MKPDEVRTLVTTGLIEFLTSVYGRIQDVRDLEGLACGLARAACLSGVALLFLSIGLIQLNN